MRPAKYSSSSVWVWLGAEELLEEEDDLDELEEDEDELEEDEDELEALEVEEEATLLLEDPAPEEEREEVIG